MAERKAKTEDTVKKAEIKAVAKKAAKATAKPKAPVKAKTPAKPKAPPKTPAKAKISAPGKVAPETKETAGGKEAEWGGRYFKAVGRRKRAVVQVRLYENGQGLIAVNGKPASQYFPGEGFNLITQPLKVTGRSRDFNFSLVAKGGGKSGQTEAARLGISRALLLFDPATKEALKANNFLTRDPRQVERKKPGLKKARKAPQWSKR